MNKKCCIYKLTNLINHKIYIGVTNNIKRRLIEHQSVARNHNYKKSLLYDDINIYGFENFKVDIIEYCSIQEKYEKEIYYIEYYQSNNENIGYNITKGGLGGKTHDINGENNPMFGKKYSDEEKLNLSKKLLGRKNTTEHNNKISNGLKNKPKSEKHKKNLSLANKGHKPPNCKIYKVININTNEILEFKSGADMERILHCSRKTIDNNKITTNGFKKYIDK